MIESYLEIEDSQKLPSLRPYLLVIDAEGGL